MSLIDEDKQYDDRLKDENNSLRREIESLEELKQIRRELEKLNQYLHIITGEKL